MPDLSYDETKSLSRLGIFRQSSPNLVEEARKTAETESRPPADCLAEVCRSHHALPTDKHLLATARGKDLEALVEPLVALRVEWDEAEEQQEKRRELEEKLRTLNEQSAPPDVPTLQGNGPTSQVPRTRMPATTEGGEVEESDEEPEDVSNDEPEEVSNEEPEKESSNTYRVLLTGDFEELVRGCSWPADADMQLNSSFLLELLTHFAEKLGEGYKIGEESSITVIPMTDEDTDEVRDDDWEQVEESGQE